MSSARIPNALEMQEIKYGNRPDEEKDRVAEALREHGRRSEAVLLFDGRPDHPFLGEEKRWAIEEGAAFHLISIKRLGAAVTDDDLRVCALSAERRGRWMDARQCWAALDAEDEIRRFAEHLPEGLRPAPPESEEEPSED